jgi:hypothetical protein
VDQNVASSSGEAERVESASEILRDLAAYPETKVPFGKIVTAAGTRVHGLALFLFVLPETLPLPLPSASSILGIPLLLISGHLAVFGEAHRLPQRILDLTIPRPVFVAIARYVAPVLAWLEKASRPRWKFLVREERLMGLLCFYLALILFMPLPLINAAPALCLAAVALGILHRDGVLIIIGCIGSILLTTGLVFLADQLARVASWMTGWFHG